MRLNHCFSASAERVTKLRMRPNSNPVWDRGRLALLLYFKTLGGYKAVPPAKTSALGHESELKSGQIFLRVKEWLA